MKLIIKTTSYNDEFLKLTKLCVNLQIIGYIKFNMGNNKYSAIIFIPKLYLGSSDLIKPRAFKNEFIKKLKGFRG